MSDAPDPKDAEIAALREALHWARDVVHCSHGYSLQGCEWPFCKKVAALLAERVLAKEKEVKP